MIGIADICRVTASGIELRVRLTPNAGRDQVGEVAAASDGSHHLVARVRAVPEKGAANKALELLLACWLGVPRSSVAVSSGGKSRRKSVSVSGDPAELSACVQKLLQEQEPGA